MAEVALTLVDDQQVGLPEDTYAHIFVSRLTCQASEHASPSDVLAALMHHEFYADGEANAVDDREHEPPQPGHGPFILSKLALDDYESVGPEHALAVVHEFLHNVGATSLGEEAQAMLTSLVLAPIQKSSALFRLTADESKHSVLGLVWLHHFELVVIAPDSHEVMLIMGFLD